MHWRGVCCWPYGAGDYLTVTSLYNRATPSQSRILRAVEGAIKNTCHAHPDLNISARDARSISKRAAGTLTAGWPDVLALRDSVASDSGALIPDETARLQLSDPHKATVRGASKVSMRPALRHLRAKLRYEMKRIKRDEHPEYARAIIDVLKMIAALKGCYT